MFQFIIHYGLHFLAPGLISYLFFRNNWKNAWLLMIATMIVDLDHLLADPIFDPNRCSIGFHPLHTQWAIFAYMILFFISRNQTIQIISIGLLFHMLTDTIDCILHTIN